MTRKAKSAREVAQKYGDNPPKPIAEDLMDTAGHAIYGFFAKTWTRRVEAEIDAKRLTATQPEVLEFFGLLTKFDEQSQALQEKRSTKALREGFIDSFSNLRNSAEGLGIPLGVSKREML